MTKKGIKEYFDFVKLNIEEIELLEDDFQKAKRLELMGIHSPDSKHLAMALRAKCDCIVTFNKKDFLLVSYPDISSPLFLTITCVN